MDELAKSHRVIAFDRPGFGYSERPRSTMWTPAAQARLIAEALRELGEEKALVVGHSFGTMVALHLALDHPKQVASLALIGGYYFPTARADVVFAAPPAIPLLGDVMRYTVSPLIGAAMKPTIDAKLFNPAPVAPSWTDKFPFEMALRPSQIRAEAAEAAIMVPAASALAPRLSELSIPVTIIAGRGDEVVDPQFQSERLSEVVPGSTLAMVEGVGHMVHHTAPERIVQAVKDLAS
jgi:pimeloyl-ACP methyl ester carboxylesterase